MPPLTLVIFSGLPGVGKSILADQLAHDLRWPLLRIDDVAGDVPANADYHFWDEKVLVLLRLVEAQLELGLSVIVDSVFMGTDRLHAQQLAQTHNAVFRPIYCFVSDESAWERRVAERAETLQNPAVATWERIKHQREYFHQWEPDTALFVDAMRPLGQNQAAVHEYVREQDIHITPLIIPTGDLKRGIYHV